MLRRNDNLANWKKAATYFTFERLQVAYWQAGVGEPLLCIHGFPTASWDWHKVWPDLAKENHLVAADMLGFGFSDKPTGFHYSIGQQADLQVALLETLKVKKVHLLAHDYGDTVAQELLARHNSGDLPFKIESICFLNGGLFPETHKPLLLQKLLISPVGALIGKLSSEKIIRKRLKSVFGKKTVFNDSEWQDLWQLIDYNDGRKVAHKLIRYMAERKANRQRWVGALQQASIPILLIDGMADPISGAHMVARFRELVPEAEVVELPAVGHYPQLEASEQVLKAYFAFRGEMS